MQTTLKLAEAVHSLRRLQTPKFDDISIELQYARHSCKAVLILNEIDPGSAPYIYNKAALIESRDGVPDLFSQALEKINELCPINTDVIEEQLLNYEGELCLMPDQLGFPYSLNDVCEMLEYPDDLNDEMAFEWFVVALGGMLEFEHLEMLVERYPEWDLRLEDLPGNGVLDWAKFEKALKRAGLAEFALAFRTIWRDTGNIYLDFDPYSEDTWNWELPDFAPEGVRRLCEEYQKAMPLISANQEALDRIQQEPEIYRKLVKIMKRCLKDTKQQAKTLLDVFAGEA